MLITTTTYDIFRHGGNKAEYLGPNHTDSNKEILVLQSAQPRVTPTSYGTRRSSLNFIQSLEVAVPHVSENETRDGKLEIKSSLPVGIADVDFDALYDQLFEMVANKALFKSIIQSGRIVRA